MMSVPLPAALGTMNRTGLVGYASAAAAFLEASLTDRRLSSKLIVFSGHHAARTAAQRDLWPGTLPADATLAIYMPGQDLAEVAASLHRSGVPAMMPCVAVSDVSRPNASYRASRLKGLADLPTFLAPTLLLVGQVFEAILHQGAEPKPGWLDRDAMTAPVSVIQSE